MSFNFVEARSLIMGIKGSGVMAPVLRQAWNPTMCCVPWAVATNWHATAFDLTIGRWTTEEIDYAVATIKENVAKLRDLCLFGKCSRVGGDLYHPVGDGKRGIQALNQSPYSR
jgi:cysteine desulfurase